MVQQNTKNTLMTMYGNAESQFSSVFEFSYYINFNVLCGVIKNAGLHAGVHK